MNGGFSGILSNVDDDLFPLNTLLVYRIEYSVSLLYFATAGKVLPTLSELLFSFHASFFCHVTVISLLYHAVYKIR